MSMIKIAELFTVKMCHWAFRWNLTCSTNPRLEIVVTLLINGILLFKDGGTSIITFFECLRISLASSPLFPGGLAKYVM